MPSTLNPFVVEIDIGGKTFDEQQVGFLSFRISLRENQIAEAVIQMAYREGTGQEAILALFPGGDSEGVQYSEATIKIKKATNGNTFLKSDFTIFKGFVVGFGDQKDAGRITVNINLRGVAFDYQNIPVISPGYHTSTPFSFNVFATSSPFQTGASQQAEGEKQARIKLASAVRSAKSGFEVFEKIVEAWDSAIKNGNLTNGGSGVKVFEAAFKAMRSATQNGKTPIANNLDVFTEVSGNEFAPNTTVNISNILQAEAMNILQSFTANPSLTFWELLLAICSKFGLNVLPFSDKVFIVPKSPLDSPVDYNIIKATDYLSISSQDFPFFTPTRAIVAATNSRNSLQVSQQFFGEYPNSKEPTNQEKKTGVFAKFFQAPGLLNNVFDVAVENAALGNPTLFDFTKNGRKVRDNLKTQKTRVEEQSNNFQTFINSYAKYLLFEDRFKQRSGTVTCRFMPTILPGFPGRIKDPLNTKDFDCNITGVDHIISSQDAQANSIVYYNHVRREGELEGDSEQNPFYGGFKVDTAATEIGEALGISGLL